MACGHEFVRYFARSVLFSDIAPTRQFQILANASTGRIHGLKTASIPYIAAPMGHSCMGRELRMKNKRIVVGLFAVILLVAAVSVFAQMNRPYHNAGVWNIGFIRIKPGMDAAYMNYLAGQWKAEQEA